MTSISKPLKVIALISGGKDSFFSLAHCLANGHQIVALGNLYPALHMQDTQYHHGSSGWDDDTESFMYQTAGHNLIPLYAKALEIPLFREEILEPPNDVSRIYQTSSKGVDEVDSLKRLLMKIKQAHPAVNAVSSGAILSTYQRTRIEAVAISLGLIPLSYLWQYTTLPPPSPGGLLSDMRQAGFDVRIIKTASGGLDDRLLWQNLTDPITATSVEKAMARFGGSVLGEGGEYETLVLNGPSNIWKWRIEVALEDMQVITEGDGTYRLMFKKHSGSLVPNTEINSSKAQQVPRKPPIWDAPFWTVLGKVTAVTSPWWRCELQQNLPESDQLQHPAAGDNVWTRPELLQDDSGTIIAVLNLTSPETGATASQQMEGIRHKICAILDETQQESSSVVFSTLLLARMSDFGDVNAIYGKLFPKPTPPARVTVACPMPPEILVAVSLMIDNFNHHCGLHVQSRSYWAPANIGPYSQAISVGPLVSPEDHIVFIAGQIPLEPATMDLLHSNEIGNEISQVSIYSERACLSLQHMWRIGLEMKVDTWAGVIAFISGQDNVQSKAGIAWATWTQAHDAQLWEKALGEDEDDSFDVWDVTTGRGRNLAIAEEPGALPNFAKMIPGSNQGDMAIPGFIAVHVKALPKECDVEWQGMGFRCNGYQLTEKSFDDFTVSTCHFRSLESYVSYIRFALLPGMDQVLEPRVERAINWVLGNTSRNDQAHGGFPIVWTLYSSETLKLCVTPVQMIPCYSVWGPGAEKLAAALVAQYTVAPKSEATISSDSR